MAVDVLKRAKAIFGRSEPEAPAAAPKKKINPYHAVSIAPGPRACAAAQGLRGKRFLSREAPALPLTNCSRGECTCHYEHHDDRRIGPRRARDMGVSIDGYDGTEKRARVKRGRRHGES